MHVATEPDNCGVTTQEPYWASIWKSWGQLALYSRASAACRTANFTSMTTARFGETVFGQRNYKVLI